MAGILTVVMTTTVGTAMVDTTTMAGILTLLRMNISSRTNTSLRIVISWLMSISHRTGISLLMNTDTKTTSIQNMDTTMSITSHFTDAHLTAPHHSALAAVEAGRAQATAIAGAEAQATVQRQLSQILQAQVLTTTQT